MSIKIIKNKLITVGWREWVSLPGLGINTIKAKVDTGARTSTLHAIHIEPYIDSRNHHHRVRFIVHPLQRNTKKCISIDALIKDQRHVRSSSGKVELRYIIETEIVLGGLTRSIEITLTNRDLMGFRMLLGRTALHNIFIVNPSKSFIASLKKK